MKGGALWAARLGWWRGIPSRGPRFRPPYSSQEKRSFLRLRLELRLAAL
jgi:hypothetical protein